MPEDDLTRSNQQTYQKKLIERIMYTNLSAENVAAKTAHYLLTLGDSRVRCSFMGQKLIRGLFW